MAEKVEPPDIGNELKAPIDIMNNAAMASLAHPSTSGEACTEFTCFDKFPVELRIRVWRFATFMPRDIIIGRSAKDHNNLTYRNHVPALLHVNVEARVEALKLYQSASFKKSMVSPSTSTDTVSLHANVTKMSPRIYFHAELDRIAIMHQVSSDGINRIDDFLRQHRFRRVAVDHELCEKEHVPVNRWAISRAYAVNEIGIFKGMVCSYEYEEDRQRVGAEQPEERGKHLRLVDMDVSSGYLFAYGPDHYKYQIVQLKQKVEATWHQMIQRDFLYAKLYRNLHTEDSLEPSTEISRATVFKALELVGRLCDYCSSPPASQKSRSPSAKLPSKGSWYSTRAPLLPEPSSLSGSTRDYDG